MVRLLHRLTLLSLPLPCSALAAQDAQVNTPAQRIPWFSQHAQVSEDGRRVIYLADRNENGVNELYGVELSGSRAPIKLNGPLVPGGDVTSFFVSPDGELVLYLADEDVNDQVELYARRFEWNAPVKLNAPLVAGGDVLGFELGPSGNRVVYRADQEQDERFDLYSTNGQTVVKLGEWTGHYQLSSQGRLVYKGYLDRVFSAPVQGGPAVQLSPDTTPPGSGALNFAISGDGTRVAFGFRQVPGGPIDLYSTPVQGGTPVPHHIPYPPGGYVGDVQLNPDGSRVVFSAIDEEILALELFSASTPGGAPVKLSVDPGPILAGPIVMTADGAHVLYLGIDPDEGRILYRVAADGGELPVRLSVPLSSGTTGVLDFELSPDERWVLYGLGLVDPYPAPDYFLVPVGGGASVPIDPDGAQGFGGVFSRDSRSVIFWGQEGSILGALTLYEVAIPGGSPRPIGGGGGITQVSGTPMLGSRRALYVGQTTPIEEQGPLQLYLTERPYVGHPNVAPR